MANLKKLLAAERNVTQAYHLLMMARRQLYLGSIHLLGEVEHGRTVLVINEKARATLDLTADVKVLAGDLEKMIKAHQIEWKEVKVDDGAVA